MYGFRKSFLILCIFWQYGMNLMSRQFVLFCNCFESIHLVKSMTVAFIVSSDYSLEYVCV